MNIQALKFVTDSLDKRPQKCSLEMSKSQDLKSLQDREAVAVYVIQVDELQVLGEFQEAIVDRGTKHKAKSLSVLLLGYKKIPVIDGNYGNVGQLVRSVRTLLQNAVKCADRNIYIIGVNELYFQALWDEANAIDKAGRPGGHRLRSLVSSFPDTRDAEDRNGAADILNRLPYYEEPPELAQIYIGSSAECRLVRQMIVRAGKVDDVILILGDTGTGKEIVARQIHHSGSRMGQFVPVNCGAIPSGLFENELFGHIKGSYTDAKSKQTGLWETAHKGTLFLDEIGDLHKDHQGKILRALNDRKIKPVGSDQEIPVDARIIAATNRDLYAMIQTDEFRDDLYYRLREFLISTPSLRDHIEDLPALATSIWRGITKKQENTLPKEIIDELCTYRWPGNVRELKSVLRHLRGLFGEENLCLDHLRTVFLVQGQLLERQKSKKIYNQDTASHNVGCLIHLRNVDDVIRACERVLRPLLENCQQSRSVSDLTAFLHLRLNELEILCLRPLLFWVELH